MRVAMIGLKGVPYPAGIENYTEQVGARLVERGHEVTVYVRPYVDVGSSYRGMGTRTLPSIDTKHLDALTHTGLATLDVMRARPDIVHYHALGPSVFSLFPRLSGLRTVAQVHGLDWQRAKWRGFATRCLKTAELAAVYFPDRTLAPSLALKRYLEKKYRRSVDYAPSGVTAPEPRPPSAIAKWGLERGNYLLYASRLVPEKGCHYLLEAYEGVETDKKLVIAGAPSHSEEYAATLQRAHRPNVVFTGAVVGDELRELFTNAYLFVLPSEIEGLSHSLLEAMSFGRCVLASDIEPNVEALGECGLTFKSRDVRDLREKLQLLVRDPGLVEERARAAESRVRRHYSWDAVVDRLEAIYRDCLESRRRGRLARAPQ